MILINDLCKTHFQLLSNRCTEFDMHLGKVTQVYSNKHCMTYFHRIMLMSFWVVTKHVYLQCITICHYVISHFDFFKTKLQIYFEFCVDVSWVDPYTFVKILVLPIFYGILDNFM